MTRALAVLAIIAANTAALEPREIYDRCAPGTVYLIRQGRTASGVVIDLKAGFILTHAHVVQGVDAVDARIKDDIRVPAQVVARDSAVDLALLEVPGLGQTKAKVIPVAPPVRTAGELTAKRVYAIGHPPDPTDTLSMWKFTEGVVSGLGALSLPELGGLVLLEHGAAVTSGNSGGPLLDGQGRLVGLNAGGRAALGKTSYAVPVNAIRAFLARNGVASFEALPVDALPVFDLDAVKQAPPPKDEPAPEAGPPLPEVEIPAGLLYGPYVHFLESKEKAALSRRASELISNLRGLFYRCPRCDGGGTIRELVRPGYYLPDGTYVHPVHETRTCPRCEGDKKIFREDRATTAFNKMTKAEGSGRSGVARAREQWVQRCHSTGRSYVRGAPMRYALNGRFATVRGPASDPLFPLHFKLLPRGTKYEWYLHDPALNGPFLTEPHTAPGHARVVEVAAGDILILEGGTLVHLCGICIPADGYKAPPRDLRLPDEAVRRLVRDELRGKMVELKRDKYTKMTCDGYPLVYVYLDGQDYGEGLLRRGLARKHPRHKCARYSTYMKAESAARKAGLGIWAE